MKSRHWSVLKTVALCCVLAAGGRAQYVEDSIDVGHAWVSSLAYNSREDVLYGAGESGVFFAISCDSNKVVESFPLQRALAADYDSTDNKAYCTFYNAQADDSLLVVDGATHTRIKSMPMEGATTPVWDPVSDRLYVSCQTTNSVAVFDCRTDSLLTCISVGSCPIMMYINSLRRKLYVLNYDNGTVSVVNLTTNQVIKTVFVGGTPNAGYYSAGADKFYSAGAYGYCTVIDGATDSIVERVPLPGANADIRSGTGNEGASLVYLGIHIDDGNYVATVRAQDDSLMANVTIGGSAWGLVYYGESGLVYSTSLGTNEVYVISGDGSQVLSTIPVGAGPDVFAIAPRHSRLYVGHENGPYVYVLRDTSAAIAEPATWRLGATRILSVFPVPFSKDVTVTGISPAKGGDVARVYAQDGRLVRQVRILVGSSRWVWDGRDDSGCPVPQGVYVAEVGGRRCKLVLARQSM